VEGLGHLPRAHPDVAHRFEEWLGNALENTCGLWDQFQALGLRRPALLAYAFHPRKVATVHELAALDLLHRGAIVPIGPDLHVTVSTVTRRSDLGPGDHATVSQDGVEAIVADARGGLVCRELWRSRISTYGLVIMVTAGIDVTDVRCARIAGRPLVPLVLFDPSLLTT
jgi:hypothetical protein